jgi:hypothetical protein
MFNFGLEYMLNGTLGLRRILSKDLPSERKNDYAPNGMGSLLVYLSAYIDLGIELMLN